MGDNTKIDHKEMWCEVVDWILLAPDSNQWLVLVNTTNLEALNFFTRWVTISFSRRTLIHGVCWTYLTFLVGNTVPLNHFWADVLLTAYDLNVVFPEHGGNNATSEEQSKRISMWLDISKYLDRILKLPIQTQISRGFLHDIGYIYIVFYILAAHKNIQLLSY
jgi:hypothetical protein